MQAAVTGEGQTFTSFVVTVKSDGHALKDWCIVPLIFSQTSLPDFPSDCVVFGQRCHRIVSLKRLADEKSFYGVLPVINGTIH